MAAVTVALALLFSSSVLPALGAEIRVSGAPLWISAAAERAVDAVWSELSRSGLSRLRAVETLGLVSSRLFNGYDIDVVKNGRENPSIVLSAEKILPWEIEFISPDLKEPFSRWMDDDLKSVESEMLGKLSGVPYQALTWGDDAFRSELRAVMEDKMPGWRGGAIVRFKEEGVLLELTVTPESPYVLATDPTIYSGTLPNILMDRLKESLLKDLSPVMGLPVSWIESHGEALDRWASAMVERRNTVSNSRSDVSISVVPSQITKVDALVESRRYVLRAWLAAQAGANGRSPELGFHIGRFVKLVPRWESELYGEFLVDLENWSLESRVGLRWGLVDPVWIGVEYVDPDDELWYRLWVRGHKKGPYFWCRYSEDYENQMALGYRINQVVSVEVNYDDRYDDRWSLRAIGDL
ncbi:hypothetical protein L2W58_02455 [Dethiosulfovibrio sp. F2B]|uniref:hypothetical protein n=1 Tax=Dethiosulfovibrio faecalis TaxID=2720018 RepID=UPI001F34DCE1|nr:hypothetical protein [Dethiosulfovibrio faecalis]MCF4150651.1 hypothetical protein [Dethiosulfovibrio faecalis]